MARSERSWPPGFFFWLLASLPFVIVFLDRPLRRPRSEHRRRRLARRLEDFRVPQPEGPWIEDDEEAQRC